MKLYWKDIELGNNTVIYHQGEKGEPVQWRVLEIKERPPGTDYYDPDTGKEYPLKKVLKSRRLSKKQEEGRLLQVPPGIYYLVVEERIGKSNYCNENGPGQAEEKHSRLRCFNVDFLETLKGVQIREE